MGMSPKDEEKIVTGRRTFLKKALVGAGSVAGFLGAVRFDTSEGIKIGHTRVALGMSEASANCSYGSSCGGGGGQCSYGQSCAGSSDPPTGGGGGQCSYGQSCGGGGGQCSYGQSCGGGGGQCSYGQSCAGGGGQCSYGSNCAGS